MDTFNRSLLQTELKRDEGLRLKAYLCTAGKLTIGHGHTSCVNLGDVCTAAQAAAWLDQDIDIAAAGLDRALPWWRKLSDGRQRSLINMCFNIGLTRLLGFKRMLYALQVGNYEGAAIEALNSKWAGQVGDRATRIADLLREG
jgi:lysozyme